MRARLGGLRRPAWFRVGSRGGGGWVCVTAAFSSSPYSLVRSGGGWQRAFAFSLWPPPHPPPRGGGLGGVQLAPTPPRPRRNGVIPGGSAAEHLVLNR